MRLLVHLKNSKKAQTWSFDLIIAVVLFIVVVSLFYSFLSSDKYQDKTSRLESGAEVIINQLNCDAGGAKDVCIINKGAVTADSLSNIIPTNMTYEQLKAELGVSGEFCIYLRSADGSLVPFPGNYSSVGKNTTTLFDNGAGVTIHCGDVLN